MPILGIAGAALIVGVILGAGHIPAEQKLADQFVGAWERGDYGAMYNLISDDARHRTTPVAFADAYRTAAATATALGLTTGKAPDPQDGVVTRARARAHARVGRSSSAR